MEKKITTNHLSFSYGNKEILKDISFNANEGEITYLAGENGSGKTTWIKLASSLLVPHSGNITFDDKIFKDIQENFSIVFDIPPLYPQLSGADNLSILYKVNLNSVDTKELLSTFGFDNRLLKMKGREYSLGQRHRLGIIGALLRQSKYIILDEPDIGLDPKAWSLVEDSLLSSAQKGSAIILTGQNYNLLDNIVNKIVILHKGSIVFDGETTKLKERFKSTPEHQIDLKQAFEACIKG